MHNSGIPMPDLATLFAQAQPLTKHQEFLLPSTYAPAYVDITSPAKARGSAATLAFARLAASDMKLPQRFEGFKAKFVDVQGLFLTPVPNYNEKDPDCYAALWSQDGKELYVDLTQALVSRKWGTPAGHIRRAPVYMARNMPNNAGSALYIDLQNSSLRARPKKKAKKKDEAAPAGGSAAKQVAAAKQEGAPEQGA